VRSSSEPECVGAPALFEEVLGTAPKLVDHFHCDLPLDALGGEEHPFSVSCILSVTIMVPSTTRSSTGDDEVGSMCAQSRLRTRPRCTGRSSPCLEHGGHALPGHHRAPALDGSEPPPARARPTWLRARARGPAAMKLEDREALLSRMDERAEIHAGDPGLNCAVREQPGCDVRDQRIGTLRQGGPLGAIEELGEGRRPRLVEIAQPRGVHCQASSRSVPEARPRSSRGST